MRGKVNRAREKPVPSRITPAYAGKSGMYTVRVLRYEDHPRLCGEKLWYPYGARVKVGSPPPMRGKGTVVCQ